MSEELQETSASCCAELTQIKEKYAYLLADFENHRRREATERASRLWATQAVILTDLLPLVDDFERALHPSTPPSTGSGLKAMSEAGVGFELIYKNLLKLLEKYGVTEVTQNQVFDPNVHEVLLQVSQEGKQPGDIVAVLRKGYMLKGQVLRPAQVSVIG
jgi:molecular chaperone GrpE